MISKARDARIAEKLRDADDINRRCAADPVLREWSIPKRIPDALHPHLNQAMRRFAARHRAEFEDRCDISLRMNIRKKMGADIHLFIQVSVFSTNGKTQLCFIPSIAKGAGGDDWRHLDAPYVRKGVNDIPLDEIDPATKNATEIVDTITNKLDQAWKYLSELTR